MAPLCAEFGISRKTGYKIFDRYKDCGVQAFSDRSHRAHRQANRLPAPIEATIVRLKREYPGWGALSNWCALSVIPARAEFIDKELIGSALRASGQYWAAAGFFAGAGLSAVCKSIQVAADPKEDKLSHRIGYIQAISAAITRRGAKASV